MSDQNLSPLPSANVTAAASPPGWLARNWKWFVPTVLMGFVLLFVAGIALVVLLVMGSIKNSDPYHMALAAARSSAEMRAKLGTPIRDSWWVSGSINVENSSGKADLSFPVRGPKGKATIYVSGTKTAGQWTLTTLEAEVDGEADRVPLLQAAPVEQDQ